MYRPMRASRDQSSSFPDRDESRSLDHRNDQSLILVLVGIHYWRDETGITRTHVPTRLEKTGRPSKGKRKKEKYRSHPARGVRTISTPQVLDGEGCWLVAWDSDTLYFSKYLRLWSSFKGRINYYHYFFFHRQWKGSQRISRMNISIAWKGFSILNKHCAIDYANRTMESRWKKQARNIASS